MDLNYIRIKNFKEEIKNLLIKNNGEFIIKDHENLIEKAKELKIDENQLLMMVLEIESKINWNEIEEIKQNKSNKEIDKNITLNDFLNDISTEKENRSELNLNNNTAIDLDLNQRQRVVKTKKITTIKIITFLGLLSYLMIGIIPFYFAENYEKYLGNYFIITITHIPFIYYSIKILIKNEFKNYTIARISYFIFLLKILNSISFLNKIQEEIEKSRNLVFDTTYFDMVIFFQYLFFASFLLFTICFRRSYNHAKRNKDLTFSIDLI
jgi:hypothetical protein